MSDSTNCNCDFCAATGQVCHGKLIHCLSDIHCIATSMKCFASKQNKLHSSTCCVCKHRLKCDQCAIIRMPHCIGQDAHCSQGWHCTTTTAECAYNRINKKHSSSCCNCQEELYELSHAD